MHAPVYSVQLTGDPPVAQYVQHGYLHRHRLAFQQMHWTGPERMHRCTTNQQMQRKPTDALDQKESEDQKIVCEESDPILFPQPCRGQIPSFHDLVEDHSSDASILVLNLLPLRTS